MTPVTERRTHAVIAAYEAAGADLEQKIARKWRLDPLVVALVAQERFRRSLTDERDLRVTEQASSRTTPRVLQALRGHITRALLQELEPELTKARERLRPARRRR